MFAIVMAEAWEIAKVRVIAAGRQVTKDLIDDFAAAIKEAL